MGEYKPRRMALTRAERHLLRLLLAGGAVEEVGMLGPAARAELASAARGLEAKGLARAAYEEGGAVADARATALARQYVAAYPSLRNPVPWGLVRTWLAIALAAGSLAVALFACALAAR